MEEPNFWDNPEEAQEQMKQLSSMKEDRDTYQKLVSAKEDMETLIEMGQEEDDDSVVPEIAEMMEEFKASFDAIRIKTLLSGEFDKDNAIIKLNAGAGGTEACDWCGMLYRMYTRWAERKGFTIEELDFLDGDEAGVKSVTFQVNGENAYGYLKSEKEFTVSSVFLRSTRQENARHRSYRAMLCRISTKRSMLRFVMRISVSIRTVPAVPADSTSTRRHRRSESRICRPASWLRARMSVPSSRTRTRQCRC